MGTISSIRRYAPFGPEQTRAMGIAFDVAWDLLEARVIIPEEHVKEVRAQLGRRILELAQQGECNPDRLASYALIVMRM
jgi:hypothetical protein